tara:strand:+ start:650 stop:841 length:192 start_codon:yes stop_codon:yes gene_type:complete
MKANLKIELDDLKTLFACTRGAHTMTFADWSEDCVKSYMSYFNNKEYPYTYSQWVNAQIIALY